MPTTTRNTNLRFKGQLQTRSDVYALHNQALQHGPFMMDASSAHASNINTHTHTHAQAYTPGATRRTAQQALCATNCTTT